MCSSHGRKGSRLSLRVLLFLFVSAFLFINCLLINACWYIHFGLQITSSYLLFVPLFKDHRSLVYDCSLACSVSRWVFLHFQLFCIESVGFPINFVKQSSEHNRVTTTLECKRDCQWRIHKHNMGRTEPAWGIWKDSRCIWAYCLLEEKHIHASNRCCCKKTHNRDNKIDE